MFFVFGISQGKKALEYAKTVICAQCGGYGRYQVFMTYSYFSLFFIPIIKWNRHYYVQMLCCSTIYELDQEVGRRLAHGEQPDITEKDLTLVQAGRRVSGWNRKRCENCGYETEEDFEYCPKCGTKL